MTTPSINGRTRIPRSPKAAIALAALVVGLAGTSAVAAGARTATNSPASTASASSTHASPSEQPRYAGLQPAVRAALDVLVASGRIDATQAAAVFEAQASGSLDLAALVRGGVLTDDQATTVGATLDTVKRADAATGTFGPDVPNPPKPAAPDTTAVPNLPDPTKPSAPSTTPAPAESAPSKP
jgi:hypothetical protein